MLDLTLKPVAIGSLPHKNAKEAIDFVFNKFASVPFWPQLGSLDRREDMTIQYSQNVPGLIYDEDQGKVYFESETDEFYEKLEEFFIDYEEIVNEKNLNNLEKYAITSPYSSTLELYFERLKIVKPKFAKGQVIGPFTWGTSICDDEGRCAFYNDTLKEIVVKALCLKALWQIEKIKTASPETTPVIFMDEPAISQFGTSAFITVKKEDIIEVMNTVAEVIKANGALSAVHCCGKSDWSVILGCNIDIVNLDAYFFAESLSLYHTSVENFIKKGGYIAWGVVPTLDKDALIAATPESMAEKFEAAVDYLVKKGVSKDLIIEHSFLTPSCGAGGLSLPLAQKAMDLTCGLSKELSERYLR